MLITLPPPLEKLLDERVQSGEYSSREDLVAAAIAQFLKHSDTEGDFEPGELEALIREGARDVDQGNVSDGPAVFAQIRAIRNSRH